MQLSYTKMLNEKEQKLLLEIARKSIQGERLNINIKDIPEKLKEKRATFVTLEKNDKLRGCIGSIIPMRELYRDVEINANNAAENDPRFNPVTKDEVKDITIEISVLTPIQETTLKEVKPFKDGLYIVGGGKSSLFLPQVWKSFYDIDEFVSALCKKAGLNTNYWRTSGSMKYYKFQVESFKG